MCQVRPRVARLQAVFAASPDRGPVQDGDVLRGQTVVEERARPRRVRQRRVPAPAAREAASARIAWIACELALRRPRARKLPSRTTFTTPGIRSDRVRIDRPAGRRDRRSAVPPERAASPAGACPARKLAIAGQFGGNIHARHRPAHERVGGGRPERQGVQSRPMQIDRADQRSIFGPTPARSEHHAICRLQPSRRDTPA